MSSVFTDEQFVLKWLEAKKINMNQSWVADELDVTRQAVETRKQALTRAGVKLPELPRVNRGMHRDVGGLNQLITKAGWDSELTELRANMEPKSKLAQVKPNKKGK